MRRINEDYLAGKIVDYCGRSRSDLEIFVSLVCEKDEGKYEEIDYDALLSHYRGLIGALTLIEIYEENFNRERFCNAKVHVEDYVSKAKGILIDLLMSKK